MGGFIGGFIFGGIVASAITITSSACLVKFDNNGQEMAQQDKDTYYFLTPAKRTDTTVYEAAEK